MVSAPAASAPTEAVPATTPPTLTFTVVAGEAADPALRTVALTVTLSVSTGAAGDQDSAVTVRSGLGAGVPMTCSSATCAPGAPELVVTATWTSAARPVTGIRTEFWLVAGSKV